MSDIAYAAERARDEWADEHQDAPTAAEQRAEAVRAALRGDQRPGDDDAYLLLMGIADRHADGGDYINRAAELVIRLAEATHHHQIDSLIESARRWVAEVVEDEMHKEAQ